MCPVNKYFQFQGSGFPYTSDFFPGKFPASTTREKPSVSAVLTPAGRINRHLCRSVKRHIGCKGFDDGGNAQVLHDECVYSRAAGGMDTALQIDPARGRTPECLAPDEPALRIDGRMSPPHRALPHQNSDCFACTEIFLSQIHCVSAAAHGGFQCFHRTDGTNISTLFN